MPFVELAGVDLWYTDTGGATGTPVIFMHAASGTSDSWVHQVSVFTQAGYRCVAYDRRNRGRSRLTSTGDQPGYVGDDLHALVMHLNLDRFHLVATAAGGIGGLDYALEHPERVRSLVVACSIGGVQDPAYLDVQSRLWPPVILELPVHLRELGPSYRGVNPEGTQRWMEIELTSGPKDISVPAQPLRQLMTFARLETMRISVLVLAGGADLLSPPALMRLLSEHIPSSEFALIPEAGHAAFWEQPEVWNPLVLEFLGRHDS